jgi:hypothetical protein
MAVVYAAYVIACREGRKDRVDRAAIDKWFEEHILELPEFRMTEDFKEAYFEPILTNVVNKIIETKEKWLARPKPVEILKDEAIKDEDEDEDEVAAVEDGKEAPTKGLTDKTLAEPTFRPMTTSQGMDQYTTLVPMSARNSSDLQNKEIEAFRALAEMAAEVPPELKVTIVEPPEVPLMSKALSEARILQTHKVNAPLPGQEIPPDQKLPGSFPKLPPIAAPLPLPDGDLAFHNAIARAMNEHRLWLARTNNRGAAPSYPATLMSTELLRQAGILPPEPEERKIELQLKRKALENMESAQPGRGKRVATSDREGMSTLVGGDGDFEMEDGGEPNPTEPERRHKVDQIRSWIQHDPLLLSFVTQANVGVNRQWAELTHDNASLLRRVEDLQTEVVKTRTERDEYRHRLSDTATLLVKAEEDLKRAVESYKKWTIANPPAHQMMDVQESGPIGNSFEEEPANN